MRSKVKYRLPELPPILEIDEDGLPVSELEGWTQELRVADGETPVLRMDDWPAELED